MGDPDDLTRHYDRMSDERLLAIALHEAADLRPEAVEILRGELRKRQLGHLSPAIEVQLLPPDEKQIASLVRRFRALPCPECGASGPLRNAFFVARVTSMIVVTRFERELVIACPRCIVAAANRADRHTAVLGWWGIPWGPIRSIQALVANSGTRRASGREMPSEELVNYVTINRGEVTRWIGEATPAILDA